VIFATAPFLGAVIAWVVLTDPIDVVQIVALLIAAVGVAVSLRSDHLHTHWHDYVRHTHEHDHTDGHHDHVHDGGFTGRHSHVHEHAALAHSHPHVPDLHHRHEH